MRCLFLVEEILANYNALLVDVCPQILRAIPPGWQYPDICRVKIEVEGQTFSSADLEESTWKQQAAIVINDMEIGNISVCYLKEMTTEDDGPFLKEETRLLQTIANLLSSFIAYQRIKQIVDHRRINNSGEKRGAWQTIMETISEADTDLYLSISRQMLWHLCVVGAPAAETLCRSYGMDMPRSQLMDATDEEIDHSEEQLFDFTHERGTRVFEMASEHLDDQEIMKLINGWIQDDRLSALAQVANRNLPLFEVADAIRRYYQPYVRETEIPTASMKGIRVSLVRRLLSDQLEYINVAKKFITVQDINDLLQSVIYGTESQGKLGGKSAALFLARQILRKKSRSVELLKNVTIPRTWYITSDIVSDFLRHHSLGHVVEQKYKSIDLVRLEYPHIVEAFRSGQLPDGISKALSTVLDDFGKRPLIVRSSSLLEERIGADFSGKYKSICLPNQGSKRKRMIALTDAITEIYASTFSPEAIEYRAECGLLDYAEEMGIMIQEVVGRQAGKYFLPTFSGTALSTNKIGKLSNARRKDGLLRLVPGLSTLVVDDSEGDNPVLIAPVKSGLRFTNEVVDIINSSPGNIGVINMETGTLETMKLAQLHKEVGSEIHGFENVISVVKDGHLHPLKDSDLNSEDSNVVAAFDGLIKNTSFVAQVEATLKTLEKALGFPVRIEFACDGENWYLLQCGQQMKSRTM